MRLRQRRGRRPAPGAGRREPAQAGERGLNATAAGISPGGSTSSPTGAWVAGEVTDELWRSRGWATGYDPTGLGGNRSRYSWLAVVMQGSFGHVGEIEALMEMRKRQQRDQPRATGAKPQLARAETGV